MVDNFHDPLRNPLYLNARVEKMRKRENEKQKGEGGAFDKISTSPISQSSQTIEPIPKIISLDNPPTSPTDTSAV